MLLDTDLEYRPTTLEGVLGLSSSEKSLVDSRSYYLTPSLDAVSPIKVEQTLNLDLNKAPKVPVWAK
jgi:hypothetical protein